MRIVVEQKETLIGTWLPILSTIVAASAALASWLSVRQARMIWQAGGLPDLQPAIRIEDGEWLLSVENAGGGLAKGTAYAVVIGASFDDGVVGERGFLRPGEGSSNPISIDGTAGADTAPEGAVFCEDVKGSQHAWSLDGEHVLYGSSGSRTRRLLLRLSGRKKSSRRAVLSNFYADAADRIDSAT
jgi:hypothetical protein